MKRRPRVPDAEVRAKSIAVRRGHATLVPPVAGDGSEPAPVPVAVHHLHSDGTLSVVLDEDRRQQVISEYARWRGTTMVELVDLAPVPLREPARGLLWITGRVHGLEASEAHARAIRIAERDPHPDLLDVGHGAGVLCVHLASVVLADAEGTQPVRLPAFLTARPDPFSRWESEWLAHLESEHPDVLRGLARHVPPRVPRGRLRPLGLDRFGLRLRVESTEGDHDVRIAFNYPACDLRDVERELHRLLTCGCAGKRVDDRG
ncbi:DUF2470 domain-containing protein [Haloechinothrix sp. LS1_15]|uniref:DUF2470 domain-containing protein n=1 Tax=Haloechinothrix sp. LS1_15 TaxID=2652248 RepID=UPI002945F41A|nr:DUF2470 domain-containing protein [Haloechinothrix sp. LS1_15]MDV6011325.1 DUF2470 domain-containing protein [Haloechinothrix sp. LS1_15]